MSTSTVGALSVQTSGAQTVVEDRACAACAACRAGWAVWCSSPLARGEHVLRLDVALTGEEILPPLLASAAFVASARRGDAIVLAVGSAGPVSLPALVRLVHGGEVIAAAGAGEPAARAVLADLSPTGRADVVVSCGDIRAAVRAVSRGGVVCLPGASGSGPSITELVQREVRLVGPRRLGDLVAAAGRPAVEAVLSGI